MTSLTSDRSKALTNITHALVFVLSRIRLPGSPLVSGHLEVKLRRSRRKLINGLLARRGGRGQGGGQAERKSFAGRRRGGTGCEPAAAADAG